MTKNKVTTAVIAALTAVTITHAQTPASSLAPLAFLTAHEWDAQLPDGKDGKKVKIHAQFVWTANHQAIRMTNQFVIDGVPKPYVDGFYVFDPKQNAIAFEYVNAEGGLTRGTVKQEGGTLVHEFEETEANGKSSQYVARVTPHGTDSWENEILARKPEGLSPIVKVRYEAAK